MRFSETLSPIVPGWGPSSCEVNGGIMARRSDPAGGTGLAFQAERWYEPPQWPEQPDRQTKMLHFDMEVDDLAAGVAHAVAADARLADQQPQAGVRVLFDPAGHPFCLFRD
jgi:hypothetical protein